MLLISGEWFNSYGWDNLHTKLMVKQNKKKRHLVIGMVLIYYECRIIIHVEPVCRYAFRLFAVYSSVNDIKKKMN